MACGFWQAASSAVERTVRDPQHRAEFESTPGAPSNMNES